MADPPNDPLLRAPVQERSRRTLERILAAGWRLLEAGGPDALTVQSITKLARTSVGSFYARFEGKDELLRYMGEGTLVEALAGWEALRGELERERSGGADLRATLERAVEGLGDFYLDGPGQRLARMGGAEDPSPSRRRRLDERIAAELSDLFGGRGVRTELAVRVLTGTLHDAAARATRSEGAKHSPYPPLPLLLSELVELLTGYLGGEVQPPMEWEEEVPEAAAAPEETPEESPEAASEQDEEPAPDTPEPPPPPATPAPPDPDPFAVWG